MKVPGPENIEINLARELEALHQLLYTRGGIRPVNAAVEELSKLLLLKIAADRFPDMPVGANSSLERVVDPEYTSVNDAKQAFSLVIGHPDLAGRVPGGGWQPVWPLDEPLRITRDDILSEALRIFHTRGNTTDKVALDPLGTAFDVFLSGKYEHAGGLGTHLTPTTVTTAITRIGFALLGSIDWGQGLLVADPCCGTGRFLVAALEEVRSYLDRQITPKQLEEFASNGIIGADQSSSSIAKARVNLLSYGIHQPEIFAVEDSIIDPSLDLVKGRVKLILTNPPFGEGKYDSNQGIARTAWLFPELSSRTRIDPALAFIARCLDLLQEDGVLGIVLPDGILDGKIFRENLYGKQRLWGPIVTLEAIISLPSATFALGGTTAKTSAVFLRKGASSQKRVYLGRAEHVGYIRQAGVAAADPFGDDLPVITDTIVRAIQENFNPGTEVISRLPLVTGLTRAEPVSIDLASLDPEAIEAYETVKAQGGIELGTLLLPIKRRRHGQIPADTPFISVLHVDDLGIISWREACSYQPSTPGIVAHAGEIIVSLLNPRKFRATVIPEDYPIVQCSAEFGVFAANQDPYAVLALMQHPLVRAQVAPLGRGTSSSRRRIEPEDLLHLLVPHRDSNWVTAIGEQVRIALDTSADAESKLFSYYTS